MTRTDTTIIRRAPVEWDATDGNGRRLGYDENGGVVGLIKTTWDAETDGCELYVWHYRQSAGRDGEQLYRHTYRWACFSLAGKRSGQRQAITTDPYDSRAALSAAKSAAVRAARAARSVNR